MPEIRQGRPPQQERKIMRSVMLEPEIVERIQKLARQLEKTESAMMRQLILDALEQR